MKRFYSVIVFSLLVISSQVFAREQVNEQFIIKIKIEAFHNSQIEKVPVKSALKPSLMSLLAEPSVALVQHSPTESHQRIPIANIAPPVSAPPVLNASTPTREGATPTAELSVGFNGPQYWTAQFPGLTLSVAVNGPRKLNHGMALVGELDVSYVRLGRMAGLRIYGRSGPLFTERRTWTYFGQILVGTVTGGESGVIRSKGGFGLQPGLGIDYGAGTRAFHIQVDYRIVPGGFIEDTGVPGQHVASLSGPRCFLGLTWRFRSQ